MHTSFIRKISLKGRKNQKILLRVQQQEIQELNQGTSNEVCNNEIFKFSNTKIPLSFTWKTPDTLSW